MYRLTHRCFHRTLQCASRVKLIYIFSFIGLTILLDFFGIFTHFLEITYDSDFVYPYEDDVHEFVNALRHNAKPAVNPINDYNYSYVIENKQKCVDTAYNNFRVVYIIKSAMENADRRSAIRNSWGFEKRFFDVPSRTLFLLGVHPNDDELQNKIKLEAAKYKDIVQVNFTDTYYNNTIKTMTGFKWLVQHCLNSKFYMFVDDDMYVSVKNVLRFIRNPANYPDYLKEPKKFGAHKREISEADLKEVLDIKNKMTQTNINISSNKNISIHYNKQILKQNVDNNTLTTVPLITNTTKDNYKKFDRHLKNSWKELIKSQEYSRLKRPKRQIFDFELPEDVRLFAGFVIVSSPHRHKSSKWYVPLSEYPYHLWPPYITAGAYILSKEALLDMYYTSLYTKLFRFDDIFLSLVAKKADIEPFHCEEFHFYKKDYTKFNYKYVITSHGYSDPGELLYVWNEQKALGNA